MVKKLFLLSIVLAVCFMFNREILSLAQKYVDRHEKKSWAPRVQYFLGNMYMGLRDYSAAEKAYLLLKKKYPLSAYAPAAQFKIAGLYEKQEDYPRAKLEYERFLTEYPHSRLAIEVKYKLNLLSYMPATDSKKNRAPAAE